MKYRVAIIREEGSTLGVWVAHGEGRCFWSDDAVKEEAMRQNCVALKYVDDDGNVTMGYPMNPLRLRGRRSGSDLAHLPSSVIHLDVDSTVVGTLKDGVCCVFLVTKRSSCSQATTTSLCREHSA